MVKIGRPTVSIVVPIYNTQLDHLKLSLDSIASQSYDQIQVVLVNDGSKKGVADYCDEYVKQKNNWHVIHQENQGASAARNVGLRQATGDYVQFVDADDICDARMVEKMVRSCEEGDADIAICRYDTFRSSLDNAIDSEPLGLMTEVDTVENSDIVLNITSPSIWKMLFRSNLLGKNKLNFDTELIRGEDLLFGGKALVLAKKIVLVNDVLYHYRLDAPSGIISSRNPRSFTTFRALEKLKTFIEDRGLYSRYKLSFTKLILNGALLYDYDYIHNSDMFAKNYRKLHTFSRGLLDSLEDEEVEEIRQDESYVPALLVAESGTVVNFYAGIVRRDRQIISQNKKDAISMQDHISSLKEELSSTNRRLDALEDGSGELSNIRSTARLLVNSVKKKLKK